MATSVTALAVQLKEETEWQRTPFPLTMQEYEKMIKQAIKRLFVDTSRASEYSDTLFFIEEVIGDEASSAYEGLSTHIFFDMDFMVDEELYIMLLAKIEFFKKVQSDVNNIVGYTTNALTVTNADKPYAHLQNTIADLNNERRIIYYKMIRFCM